MASLTEIQRLVQQIKDDLPLLIARSQVAPKQIVTVTGLSDITERLGLVQAGEFRVGNGLEPGYGFTGVRIGYPAFTYDGDTWHVAGVNDDVLQFGLSATDGRAYFATGKAILNSDGMILEASNALTYPILWKTDDNQTTVGKIGAFYVGSDSGIEIVGVPKSGAYVAVAHLITKDSSNVRLVDIEVRSEGEIQIDLRSATIDTSGNQKVRIMSDVNSTNAANAVLYLESESKGTVAAGFGTAIVFMADNASASLENIAYISAVYTDPTNNSEDTKVMLGYSVAGAAVETELSAPRLIPFINYGAVGAAIAADTDLLTASVDRTMTFVSWTQACIVLTTNNGSNYWTISLLRLSDGATINSMNTSAQSANAWVSMTDSSFSVSSVSSSDKGVYIRVAKTGAPGTLGMAHPAVSFR